MDNAAQTPRRTTLIMLAALVALAGSVVVLLARHDSDSSSPSGSSRGSGVAAAQTRNVPAFTSVDLAGANNVVIHVGGEQKVVVRADDNLLGRVTTGVRDGRLVIGSTGSFSARSPMRVDIAVPSLDSVTLSGSGVVIVDGLHATTFTVEVPGSGVLRVSGTADRLDATLGGSGDVDLQGLVAHDATAVVAGSGRVQVHASRSLDATVSGVGAIYYSGNPSKVAQSITGTGSIAASPAP
jgi:hypothetical protein